MSRVSVQCFGKSFVLICPPSVQGYLGQKFWVKTPKKPYKRLGRERALYLCPIVRGFPISLFLSPSFRVSPLISLLVPLSRDKRTVRTKGLTAVKQPRPAACQYGFLSDPERFGRRRYVTTCERSIGPQDRSGGNLVRFC